jgi:VanZ family protein
MTTVHWRGVFFLTAFSVLLIALAPTSINLPSSGWDKSNHFLAFSVLAYLGCKSFSHNVLTLTSCLIVYGGMIEVLQTFTPTRVGEWQDLVADTLGVLTGWFLSRLF